MADFPPPALQEAAEEVAALLRERKETISVAETAAGGLVSAALLSTPGASKIYKGGLTLYTLESRIAFAGWTQENIDNYDGPTPQLVAGLATHVRQTLKSTYCVGEV
jgi:nicotinamide mononucleotide (NMN) deamidase PncC